MGKSGDDAALLSTSLTCPYLMNLVRSAGSQELGDRKLLQPSKVKPIHFSSSKMYKMYLLLCNFILFQLLP